MMTTGNDRFLKQQINKILNSILVLASVLGTASYLLSLLAYFKTGFEWSFVTDFIVIGIFILTTYQRKKLPTDTKSHIIVFSLIALIGMNVYEFGLLSADLVLLILLPFLSVFSFSVRRAISFFAIGVLIVLTIALLQIYGFITPLPADPLSPSLWTIHLLHICAVAIILFIIVIRFIDTYKQILARLTESNYELQVSEESYAQIFNATLDAFLLFDTQGELKDYNFSLLRIYGSEVIDNHDTLLKDLFDADEKHNFESFQSTLKKSIYNKQQIPFWKIRRKDGSMIWVTINMTPLRIADSQRILLVMRDINERKKALLELQRYKDDLEVIVQQRTEKLEKANKDLSRQKNKLGTTLKKLKSTQEKLIQSEKMASIGFLSSSLAHEMNNPLNIIKAGVYGIKRYLTAHLKKEHLSGIEQMIKDVNNGVLRTTKIVDSLDMYSNFSPLDDVCYINSIMDVSVSTLEPKVKSNITIVKEYDKDISAISANPHLLHHTFLNLLTNAAEAIEGKGEIRIKTKQLKKGIDVLIKDNGKGMEASIINKISDPFFSTKSTGEGIGMGLFLVYNNIKSLGGDIVFSSAPGKGTTVRIFFPKKAELTQQNNHVATPNA